MKESGIKPVRSISPHTGTRITTRLRPGSRNMPSRMVKKAIRPKKMGEVALKALTTLRPHVCYAIGFQVLGNLEAYFFQH